MQGGFGLPILSPHVYTYMTTGKYMDLHITDGDVPDMAVHALLTQVKCSSHTHTQKYYTLNFAWLADIRCIN